MNSILLMYLIFVTVTRYATLQSKGCLTGCHVISFVFLLRRRMNLVFADMLSISCFVYLCCIFILHTSVMNFAQVYKPKINNASPTVCEIIHCSFVTTYY